LSTQNFDDGQCYQVNGGSISQQRQQEFKHDFDSLMGADLWCQQDIEIPSTAPSGQPYTLYWVWDWPTLPGTSGFPDGKQEIYTTCMDVDIVDNFGVDPVSKVEASFSQGQPIDNAAIAGQLADIANPTAVTGSSIAFSASATGPVPGAASEASVSAATGTDTGVPAFLTVHTGSTAGPGIETQSFTVIPIGVTATNAQQPQHTDDSGRGDGGNGQGPQFTPAPNVNANAAVATFTEYESVTETIFQTVYNTQYTKRDDSAPVPTAAPVLDPRAAAPAAGDDYSTAHSVFRLRARNPFIWLGWSSSEAVPTPTS